MATAKGKEELRYPHYLRTEGSYMDPAYSGYVTTWSGLSPTPGEDEDGGAVQEKAASKLGRLMN